jgi:hypothetical protein
MSYFQKGQNALVNRIARLEAYVFGIHPPPSNYHVYDNCEGLVCNAPDGYPATAQLHVLTTTLNPAPDKILVNYEWTAPEGEGEPETYNWCCCYTYAESGQAPAGRENVGIVSIVDEGDCASVACVECHTSSCVITTPAPGLTATFTTGGEGSGTVDCTTSDSFNDSWNNMEISIVNTTTGVIAATYTGPPPGASPQTEDPLTLDNDTEYGIYINSKGDFPNENSILIEQDGGTLLNVSPFCVEIACESMTDCSWYTPV